MVRNGHQHTLGLSEASTMLRPYPSVAYLLSDFKARSISSYTIEHILRAPDGIPFLIEPAMQRYLREFGSAKASVER